MQWLQGILGGIALLCGLWVLIIFSGLVVGEDSLDM
jgi:hypothetical protein